MARTYEAVDFAALPDNWQAEIIAELLEALDFRIVELRPRSGGVAYKLQDIAAKE